MAVSLDVELMHDYYDEATNTSTVTATVVINYTGGSYNGYNPSGTLTINGQSYDFNSNFNYENGGSISTNGNTIAYTTTITIPHNEDGSKTVYASASFDSGVSSGTVVTSTSATLIGTPSSGGGDTGSGSGGGNGDGGEGNEDSNGLIIGDVELPNVNLPINSVLFCIDQGEHITLRVTMANSDDSYHEGQIIKNGDIIEWLYHRPNVFVTYKADDGYTVDEFTFNGTPVYNNSVHGCSSITTIKITAKRLAQPYVNIEDESDFGIYKCCIDNGITWHSYAPYISVKNYYSLDGLFEADINPISGLNLRKGPSANTEALVTIPYKSKITVKDIAVSIYGQGIWANTAYESYTGWCSVEYLNFLIYGKVNNESGTYLYLDTSLNSECLLQLSNECEIDISKLTYSDELIWGYVLIENMNGDTISGYVKMQDIGILTEREILEWIPCTIEAPIKSIKYLYKDGIMYSPLSNGLEKMNCYVNNTNNMLTYETAEEDGEEHSHAITNTDINLSDFRYLCIKTGEIGICDSNSALREYGHLYVGIGNKYFGPILHHAMYLTEDDSNKTFYVDLSTIDSFYDYYIGFGTGSNYGSYNYFLFYIKELWLSNEISDDMIYKSFDYTLNY